MRRKPGERRRRVSPAPPEASLLEAIRKRDREISALRAQLNRSGGLLLIMRDAVVQAAARIKSGKHDEALAALEKAVEETIR